MQNLLKQTALVALMLTALNSNAFKREVIEIPSPEFRPESSAFANNLKPTSVYEDFSESDLRTGPRRAREDDSGDIKVTIKLVYDPDTQLPDDAFVFNSETDQTTFWADTDDDTYYEFDLKPGKYNFLTKFRGSNGIVYIAREDVEVNGEMTIEVDTREATNHIWFRPLDKNGDEIHTDVYNQETGELLIPGNIVAGWCQSFSVYYKNNVALETHIIANWTDMKEDGTLYNKSDNRVQAWINDSRYIRFSRLDTFLAKEGVTYIFQYADDCSDGERVNNPADFVKITDRVVPTPFEPNPDDEMVSKLSHGYGMTWCDFIDGLLMGRGGFSMGVEDELPTDNNTMIVCTDPSAKVTIAPCVTLNQAVRNGFSPGSVMTPCARINEDGSITRLSFVAHENVLSSIIDNNFMPVASYDSRFMSGGENMMKYGESAPFTVFYSMPYSTGRYEFDYEFAGPLGEYRSIDKMASSFSLKCNGKTVFNGDYYSRLDFLNTLYDRPLASGRYELDILNPNYNTPDGLSSENLTHVEFDTNLEDFEAPSLRGFAIRDNADRIVQSFDTNDEASQGFIEITGCDLIFSTEYYRGFSYVFDRPLPEVKVEYAPYGTDDFTSISMTYKPEWDNVPGFGYHFIGSIPVITAKATNGWYDVRVTMTDEAGNLQRQTIGCAFQIKGQSGVETVAASMHEPEVVGIYSLQGMPIKEQASKGQVIIERLSDGISRKVIAR